MTPSAAGIICWEWNPPPDLHPSPLRAHEPQWSEPFIPPKGGERRRALRRRELSYDEYCERWRAWSAKVADEEGEMRRSFEAAARWHPIGWSSEATRLDVYGGSAEGWASLLWTSVKPLIDQGLPVSIVDLTQRDIAESALWGEHSRLPRGRSASTTSAPGEFDPLLGAASPLTVVSKLMAGTTPTEDPVHRDLESAVLRQLLGVLGADATLPRLLAAAICVVSPGDPLVGRFLRGDEVESLTAPSFVMFMGPNYELILARIVAVLGSLTGIHSRAQDMTGSAQQLPFLDTNGPSLVSTHYLGDDDRQLRVDRMIIASLIDRIEATERWNGLLVVIGCDRLDGSLLEDLIRRAEQREIRLALFFEGLRGDARAILGRGSVDTILMSLGNREDADAASGFVGRDYRWRVSSLSTSTSDQVGSGESYGANHSFTDSLSVQGLMGTSSRGTSSGWSNGITHSWNSTTTYQETRTESEEFIARPEEFARLPMTGLLFVRRIDGMRYIMSGDCHPAIAASTFAASRPIERG
jgi:hypothetical protein